VNTPTFQANLKKLAAQPFSQEAQEAAIMGESKPKSTDVPRGPMPIEAVGTVALVVVEAVGTAAAALVVVSAIGWLLPRTKARQRGR
jgi:hypothetical protein